MSLMRQILKRKSLRELDIGTHISLKNDYIYFQVSKAASSTVKHYLQQIEVENSGRKVLDVNNRYLSPHVCPSQLKEDHFESLIQDPNVLKFSFVRNPFSRLLSCYMHRIVSEPKSASNRVLKKLTNGRCGSEVKFNEFIEIVCNQEPKEQDTHWRVQYDELLYDTVPDWTFIGKIENLEGDMATLMGLLGKAQPDRRRGLINNSPMRTKASAVIKDYYTHQLVDLVVNRYYADFETFGYSTEIC